MNVAVEPYPYFWSIILPGLIIVGIVMIWKEQRLDKNKFARTLVAAFAIISLIGFSLRPSIERESNPKAYALLTPNYNAKSLDSLKSIIPELRVLNLEEVSSVRRFVEENSISRLFVLGDGMESNSLNHLSSLNVDYIPGSKPIGIVDLKHNSRSTKGKPVSLEISTRMNEDGWLIINSTEDEVDSFKINRGFHKEHIQVVKRVVGNFVDNVSLIDNKGNLLDQGLIPYQVDEPRPMRVLFLLGYPDFESRFLKNWCGEMGHQVIVKSRVSQSRYVTETVNMNESIGSLSDPEWLATLDLIITDPAGWRELSNSQRSLIHEFTTDKGLGILFLLNKASDISTSRLKELLPANSFSSSNNSKTELNLVESGVKFFLPRIELAPGSNTFSFPITNDNKKNVTSYGFFQGIGKIGFSLITGTYSLLLNGFRSTYSEYWSDILETLGKSWNRAVVRVDNSSINRVNYPMEFVLTHTGPNPQVTIDSIAVGLRQDIYFDDTWHAKFWPQRVGWHPVNINDQNHDNFFVYPDKYWQNLERERKQKFNNIHFGLEDQKEIILRSEFIPVSGYFFLAIFVICIALLWLYPRL